MVTLRRVLGRGGNWLYQILPDDLQNNLPVPPFLPGEAHSDAIKAILAAYFLLLNSEDEVIVTNSELDRYFELCRKYKQHKDS
jgi:hypothetical protein